MMRLLLYHRGWTKVRCDCDCELHDISETPAAYVPRQWEYMQYFPVIALDLLHSNYCELVLHFLPCSRLQFSVHRVESTPICMQIDVNCVPSGREETWRNAQSWRMQKTAA